MAILLQKIDSLLHEIRTLAPVAARVVGSQALRAASASHVPSGSDVDLHIIVRDLTTISYPDMFCLPKNLCLNGFDILAVKITYRNVLFSVHIYSVDLFRSFCQFTPRNVKILRNTIGKTRFVGYGTRDTHPFRIIMKQAQYGLYIAEYKHQPIVEGRFYMFPYQSMALSGITIFDKTGIAREQTQYIRSILRHLIQKEGVSRIGDFNRIFKNCYYTIDGNTRKSYNDLFLSENFTA